MNKKEIAKIEKMLRERGFNGKQIKTLMKTAKKAKVTAPDFVTITIFLSAWAFLVTSILAETTLFKKATPNRAKSTLANKKRD
jgi:hypothetical protein